MEIDTKIKRFNDTTKRIDSISFCLVSQTEEEKKNGFCCKSEITNSGFLVQSARFHLCPTANEYDTSVHKSISQIRR